MRTLYMCLVGVVATAQLGLAHTVNDVRQAYARRDESVKTLRFDFAETFVPVVSEEVLYRTYGRSMYFIQQGTVVYAADGRFSLDIKTRTRSLDEILTSIRNIAPAYANVTMDDFRQVVPYSVFRRVMNAQSPKVVTQRVVHDGEKLSSVRSDDIPDVEEVKRQAFSVVDMDHMNYFLAEMPFDDLMLALPPDKLSASWRARVDANRFPQAIDALKLKIPATSSMVDDRVTLVSKIGQEFDLAPNKAFALKARRWIHDGKPAVELIADEYTELHPELWFPKTTTKTIFGWLEDAPEANQPLYRVVTTYSHVEINRPEHEHFLTNEPRAGYLVSDQRLRPVDESGHPAEFPVGGGSAGRQSITYIQPANEKDLQRVVDEAIAKHVVPRNTNPTRRTPVLHYAMLFSAGLIVTWLVVWWCRRNRFD